MGVKNKLIISLIALVGLSYGAFHLLSDKNNAEQPPSIDIDFGGNKFGGRLSNNVGCALPGEAFSSEDAKSFSKPDGRSYELSKGLHLYHSDRDLSMAEVIENIQPVKGNKLMIISYNPVNNPDKYFSVYPGFGEGAYFPVSNPERAFIARNNAFIIVSCADSKIWNVKTENMPGADVAGNIHDIDQGWILVATGNNINYEDYPVSKAWPQTESGLVFTMGLDHQELSEYVVSDNKYIMWVKVDEEAFAVVQEPAVAEPEEEPAEVEEPAEPATPEPVEEQVEDEPAQQPNNNWVNPFRNQPAEVEEEAAPMVEEVEEPVIPYRPATTNYGLFGHQFDNGAEEEVDRDYSGVIQYAENAERNAERIGVLERNLEKNAKQIASTEEKLEEAINRRTTRESNLNLAKESYRNTGSRLYVDNEDDVQRAIAREEEVRAEIMELIENKTVFHGVPRDLNAEFFDQVNKIALLNAIQQAYDLLNEANTQIADLENRLVELHRDKAELESELEGLR